MEQPDQPRAAVFLGEADKGRGDPLGGPGKLPLARLEQAAADVEALVAELRKQPRWDAGGPDGCLGRKAQGRATQLVDREGRQLGPGTRLGRWARGRQAMVLPDGNPRLQGLVSQLMRLGSQVRDLRELAA